MLILNDKQKEAVDLTTGDGIRHALLYGGARSGKTFIVLMMIVTRALKAPGSRHGVVRKFLTSLKRSVWQDTLLKVCRLLVPDPSEYRRTFHFSNQDLILTLSNGSSICLFGLDDEERADRILGMEFCTLMFEECSELSFESIQKALTRLAQRNSLVNRAFYTENPPSKRHWSYQLFIQHIKPDGSRLKYPDQYCYMQMNPMDNLPNLDAGFVQSLEELSFKQRERFLAGNFQDDTGQGPVKREWLRYVDPRDMPVLERVVVSVDPTVEDNKNTDDCGIVAVGKCKEDNFYVLKDATLHGSPLKWSAKTATVYNEFEADLVVYESNQGGLLVEGAIQNVDKAIPCKGVRAHRGKLLRAEALSVLYERSRVFHCREFFHLEDELCDYDGEGPSPNRLDAVVYALLELSSGPRRLRPRMQASETPDDPEQDTKQVKYLQPQNEALWEAI